MRLRKLWLVIPILLIAVSLQASPDSKNNSKLSTLDSAPNVAPAQALPEPVALALFGSSLIAIATSIRRRARRADGPFGKE